MLPLCNGGFIALECAPLRLLPTPVGVLIDERDLLLSKAVRNLCLRRSACRIAVKRSLAIERRESGGTRRRDPPTHRKAGQRYLPEGNSRKSKDATVTL